VVIFYRYCHSRRRSLGMTVRPDKSIRVRVPLRTPLRVIREFVAGRAAWIFKVWAEFDGRGTAEFRRYAIGSPVLFRGEQRLLTHETGADEAVRLRGGLLVVTAPLPPSSRHLTELVNGWYREQAGRLFRARLIACHCLMFPEGAAVPALSIRPMTSRWGSYSYRTRRITLNLNLAKLPPACLDYVIIHELCHIGIRHHGPRFWQMVARYLPDHQEVRRQLRTFVHTLA
jgi:predicted metal-dependent hydrolase